MDIRALFNDESMENLLRERLDCLEDTNDILDKIANKLEEKNISSLTKDELVIKLDRRKNKEVAIEGIREMVMGEMEQPDSFDLLFSIREVGREIVIRKRRENRLD